MNSTFGAPSRARTGAGQAGVDSSAVRPITPGNATPGPYSTTGMQTTPAVRPLPLWPISCGARPEPASPATDGADHIAPVGVAKVGQVSPRLGRSGRGEVLG